MPQILRLTLAPGWHTIVLPDAADKFALAQSSAAASAREGSGR